MCLKVPWIGEPSTNLEKEVKTVVESCYGSVSTRLVFTSKRMLPVARKDVLPAIQKSFVIYEDKCHCDSRYVGRTSQRLQDRIKQHVPQWLRQQLTRPRRSQPHRSCKRIDTKPDCDSAIGQHLDQGCATFFTGGPLSKILTTSRASHRQKCKTQPVYYVINYYIASHIVNVGFEARKLQPNVLDLLCGRFGYEKNRIFA